MVQSTVCLSHPALPCRTHYTLLDTMWNNSGEQLINKRFHSVRLAIGRKISTVEAEEVQIEVAHHNTLLPRVQGPLPLLHEDDPAAQ